MKAVITLISAVLFSVPGFASAASWTIDPVHSVVSFSVEHMMISDVKGRFHDVQGTVAIDEQNLEQSKVDVSIAAASIDTGVQKRDDHLKSADFLDVAVHPTLSFASKQVKEVSTDGFTLVGDLTLHGITKEVALRVTGPSAAAKDPWGNIRKAAKGTTRINRKDFGLTWNSALETGGVLVGEEVDIVIDVQFIKQSS